MKSITMQSDNRRSGFTLVEMLVVITIIGILAALLIPAISGAISSAKSAALRMEVETLSQSIEGYQQKYGDYPPDFSDWELVKRHYRRAFPRMNLSELAVMDKLFTAGARIDASEALVWALGGFSSDPEYPFTGAGGPLVVTPNGVGYNTDRANKLFDFQASSLDLDTAGGRVTTGDGDPFPNYRAASDSDPFVYFDSRTYASPRDADVNGYFTVPPAPPSALRPYLSNELSSSGIKKFANADTFQVISPGLDGRYGTYYSGQPSGNSFAYYFEYPTGTMYRSEVTTPFNEKVFLGKLQAIAGSNGYQETSYDPEGYQVSLNHHLDNLTNFAQGKLGDEIP